MVRLPAAYRPTLLAEVSLSSTAQHLMRQHFHAPLFLSDLLPPAHRHLFEDEEGRARSPTVEPQPSARPAESYHRWSYHWARTLTLYPSTLASSEPLTLILTLSPPNAASLHPSPDARER